MKRSIRYRNQAFNKACHSAMSFIAAIAFAALAAGAYLSDSPIGSWALLAGALAAFAVACYFTYDTWFTYRLCVRERKWEIEREIRPRL